MIMSTAAEVSSEAGPDLQDKMRTTLLAQFRVSLIELRLAEKNVELIGTALKNHLVTPDEAMQMCFERDLETWIFQDREVAT